MKDFEAEIIRIFAIWIFVFLIMQKLFYFNIFEQYCTDSFRRNFFTPKNTLKWNFEQNWQHGKSLNTCNHKRA